MIFTGAQLAVTRIEKIITPVISSVLHKVTLCIIFGLTRKSLLNVLETVEDAPERISQRFCSLHKI